MKDPAKSGLRQLVLLRHGESVWNKENRFTGWTDVDLSDRGKIEALEAGRCLRANGFSFDVAYTSVLKRAIRTLWLLTDEMDLMWVPVHREWRLNERHYGALQGLNKTDTANEFGEAQVKTWRRSFDIRPPPLDAEDPRHARHDERYRDLSRDDIPATESLQDTLLRVLPCWHERIAAAVGAGSRVLIVAHGNSLRAVVKYLDKVSDADIAGVEIPTGIPLVYELNQELEPMRHYYLGADGP